MQDELSGLREESTGSDITPRRRVDEGAGFQRRWDEEELYRVRQDRAERKAYARRIFILVTIWLAVIVALLVLQGFLGPAGVFTLADSVLIAAATTTTASVTALLVVVVRYLFAAS